MTEGYRVRIFESELQVICDETLDFPNIETGGNLYGLLSHGGSPIVSLATRPAGRFHRGVTSLELDHQVQQKIEESVWAQYGIQFLGMWHSHHQLGLYEPSEGDRSRTANYAVKAHRKFYVEILCNLSHGGGSRQAHVTSAPPDQATPDGTETGQDQEEQEESRRSRRAKAREERRRAHEFGDGVGEPEHRPGKERSAGPVRVAPFVYVDATCLERADAEFVVLPGRSPVRAAVMAADLTGEFASAFRPVSGDSRGDIRYELRTSSAHRTRGYRDQSVASQSFDAGQQPEGAHQTVVHGSPDVHPAVSARQALGGQQPTGAHTPGGASQAPADVTTAAIPDMARYVHDYVEPLLQAGPKYYSTLEPLSEEKLLLRVRHEYGRAELLLVLGWDGAAPVVLSCAVVSGNKSATYPEGLDRRDIRGHFGWGIKRLNWWG
jgi:hypothetical protein